MNKEVTDKTRYEILSGQLSQARSDAAFALKLYKCIKSGNRPFTQANYWISEYFRKKLLSKVIYDKICALADLIPMEVINKRFNIY